jgi:hypothetical protein
MRIVQLSLVVCVLSFCSIAVSQELDSKPAQSVSSKTNEVHKKAQHRGPECMPVDRFFAQEVWAKVGETTCLKCHRKGGDAEDSKFLLRNVAEQGGGQAEALYRNQAAFLQMAKAEEKAISRLLAKASGGLDHGGGQVLKKNATGLQILTTYVKRLASSTTSKPLLQMDDGPFYAGLKMVSHQRLLRRVTLSLTGRLPSPAEKTVVAKDGLAGIDRVLDGVMKEDAFYERLQEAFNDIFLVRGYDDNAESVFSYDHFNKTRGWPQNYDYGDLPEKEERQAKYAMYDLYRESVLREPLELIEFIVRQERPFTEIVTANYIMVSPHTARGYGIFEELKDKFNDSDDSLEFIQTKLPALKSRNGKVQETKEGFYPHSGLLSTFHYVRRYPTTDTNRNRLRARMYYQHFLGIDIMAMAPRVTDAAAVDAKYEIPTMQAADCVVCHKTIDPVAGLFRDYDKGGYFATRDWYEDMFGPGLDDEDLPEDERWRSMQWLGERTAKDPRFPTAMVEHVYYVLTGRKVMRAPQGIDDPLFASRRRGYLAQRSLIKEVVDQFVKHDYNLKVAFKAMIKSEFYRADGLATALLDPKRSAELDDIGVVHLLTPEQLERKIFAVFGQKWGRLKKDYTKIDILYGGIDSKQITERISSPSGAMGAIQRMMANDVACKHVALDFTAPKEKRILFPGIEPTVVPGSEEADESIRRAIVHLHEHILGLEHTVDHPEVERTFQLFAGIVEDANSRKDLSKQESYHCRGEGNDRTADPLYTYRAWRGVVTYLLRQQDFLYE